MSLTALSLSAWGTLLGSLAAIVTLLYMLKLRRRRVEVPFGPLWQQVLNEKRTTSLFRMLKSLFSLLVQLAILALIVTALADPIWTGQDLVAYQPQDEPEPTHTLIVLDTSASMGATDVDGGRMGAAREAAHRIVAKASKREALMLAKMDRDVVAMTDWSFDKQKLHAQINELRAQDTGTDPAPLWQFATNAVRGLPHAQVVLVTDRGFPEPREAIKAQTRLKVVDVGSASRDNLAVLDFNVRSHLGNALKYAIYYKIKNFSRRPVKVAAYLYSDAQGEARTRAEFEEGGPSGTPFVHELAPGEEKVVEEEAIDLEGSRAALIVEPYEKNRFVDVLPTDDVAFAVVPTRRSVRALLVGAPDRYLAAALRARSQVDVEEMALSKYESAQGYDLVVFNGAAPDKTGPGNFVFINASTGDVPYKVDGKVAGSTLRVPSSKARHALMKFVKFVDLTAPELIRIKPRKGEEVLARGKGGKAAIVAQSTAEKRWVAVGFDTIGSEWVGHYSFSIFMVNAVNWFFSEEVKMLRPWGLAERWDVKVPWKGLDRVDVVAPDGQKHSALVDGSGILAFQGRQIGIYEVTHPEPKHAAQKVPIVVAAALRDATESALRADGKYAAWREPPPESESKTELDLVGADLWQLMVLLAMFLLVAEWFTYHRRWTV